MAAGPDFIGDREACIAYLRREIRMMRSLSDADIIRIYFSYHTVGAGQHVYVYIEPAPSTSDERNRWAVFIKR